MKCPRIAIVSFPGNNCEVESLRAVKQAGMEAVFFRWNDDRAKLNDVDGYFIPGGFSYEDRGRSGMVAARDPLMAFIAQEAEKGKVVIGNCNGAQILVESGLIPLGEGLDMSLARNVVSGDAVGFLSEWVWITPACKRDRCATSDWEGTMHLPIAHGEGRFTTRDKDLLQELKKNDQIAFQYCDEEGNISEDPRVTPNGAMYAIAGICNPAGNVVALMPHPERTPNGAPYFVSMKKWIEGGRSKIQDTRNKQGIKSQSTNALLPLEEAKSIELFIDTVITNNEERTVEAAARRIAPALLLKQLKYIPLKVEPSEYLRHIGNFNPNKEIAFVRRVGRDGTVCRLTRWNSATKHEEESTSTVLDGLKILRRDEPFEGQGDPGICYVIHGIDEQKMCSNDLLEIFGNPHASSLRKFI
ncbi:MAG: Phosphoribosylformylglycinamidine synthase, glutamine amidotransferase subunit [Candidatus Peregrinibacteria bacterium Greene0416_62]|nr:MAG: Phosphoribosylformylglycinamidine synthase, glutamine amidotransferase subunit [Candidatus Peregrinibacteria bacterium Greene0416_62]TSC99238.1 MAG: Phosphoribosylformylglycinamidine synthase, glutamine amidotransferase subunit [Candidatus Peregrinibacteria bacterium Greene1014_49]